MASKFYLNQFELSYIKSCGILLRIIVQQQAKLQFFVWWGWILEFQNYSRISQDSTINMYLSFPHLVYADR